MKSLGKINLTVRNNQETYLAVFCNETDCYYPFLNYRVRTNNPAGEELLYAFAEKTNILLESQFSSGDYLADLLNLSHKSLGPLGLMVDKNELNGLITFLEKNLNAQKINYKSEELEVIKQNLDKKYGGLSEVEFEKLDRKPFEYDKKKYLELPQMNFKEVFSLKEISPIWLLDKKSKEITLVAGNFFEEQLLFNMAASLGRSVSDSSLEFRRFPYGGMWEDEFPVILSHQKTFDKLTITQDEGIELLDILKKQREAGNIKFLTKELVPLSKIIEEPEAHLKALEESYKPRTMLTTFFKNKTLARKVDAILGYTEKAA